MAISAFALQYSAKVNTQVTDIMDVPASCNNKWLEYDWAITLFMQYAYPFKTGLSIIQFVNFRFNI